MVRTVALALALALGGGAPYLGGVADFLQAIWAADEVDVGGMLDPNGSTTGAGGMYDPNGAGSHYDPNGSGAESDVGAHFDPNG